MALQITELTFLNQLAHRFDLPVPEHLEAGASRRAIREALARWGGKGVVKADVMAGGRGKAGAVKVVEDPQEAAAELRRLATAKVQGMEARSAYLTQFIPAELQIYSAITYDSRFLGPSLTVSMKGSVDIESVGPEDKRTIPVDVFKGLDAYQASQLLGELGCPQRLISIMSRTLVSFWDMFISTGMRMCEVNPWRLGPDDRPYACDFKAVFDAANYKVKEADLRFPEYPENVTEFEEEMAAWDAASYRGQAHVCELGGDLVLPILFGGGASTIAAETLEVAGGRPIFLSDFGGNPPYERMYGTAERCFRHHLAGASTLLILGGKANNTLIDVTFQAIADALVDYFEQQGRVEVPVIIGRGGPRIVPGFIGMREALESLRLPYVIFGHDTPITLVAEYAARLGQFVESRKEAHHAG
ncbi:MAG: ATP-grasp domain-containing protein [Candidatus Brocadiia bacterium]